MNPLNTPRTRRYPAIIAELVDVLKDHHLGVIEARHLLNDALNDYDAQMEEMWTRQQAALMESGGPDNSQYRADMINAGRGHLLR